MNAAAHEQTLKSLGAVSAIVIPGFICSEWTSIEAALYAKHRLEALGLSGCKVVKTPDESGNYFTQWEQ